MLERNRNSNSGENSGIISNNNNGTIVVNQYTITKKMSILSNVIKNLVEKANIIDLNPLVKLDLKPFDIEKKIEYNVVIKNKFKFNKYKIYYLICDQILNAIDDQLAQSKNKLMNFINDSYEDILGEIALENSNKNKLEIIQNRADLIIDTIKLKLINILGDNEMFYEDKEFGVNIILCYAFMECKILEKPISKGE